MDTAHGGSQGPVHMMLYDCNSPGALHGSSALPGMRRSSAQRNRDRRRARLLKYGEALHLGRVPAPGLALSSGLSGERALSICSAPAGNKGAREGPEPASTSALWAQCGKKDSADCVRECLEPGIWQFWETCQTLHVRSWEERPFSGYAMACNREYIDLRADLDLLPRALPSVQGRALTTGTETTTYIKLSDVRRVAYDAIDSNGGTATIDDIILECSGMSILSLADVRNGIDALVRKGWLKREGQQISRAD